MKNKLIKLYLKVEDLVNNAMIILTFFGTLFLIMYQLYYLWYTDLEKVICSSLTIVIFLKINNQLQGGDSHWERKRRY